MDAVRQQLADPFGSSALVNSPTSGAATTPAVPRPSLPGALRAAFDLKSPASWMAMGLVVTFGLIAVAHGHVGGEIEAHVGPVHGEAGVGS